MEIQKPISCLKLAIYNKMPNYLIEHRYCWELASKNLCWQTVFLKADTMLLGILRYQKYCSKTQVTDTIVNLWFYHVL